MELSKEFKEMNCNETKERINESFDIDYQLNLPQYLDDVEKLIKCCVKNVVADYNLSSSSINTSTSSSPLINPWSRTAPSKVPTLR